MKKFQHVNRLRRAIKVIASNEDRVLYDVEFYYGADGNLEHPPRKALCMSRKGFDARFPEVQHG